jgi:predicted dehydrogenase
VTGGGVDANLWQTWPRPAQPRPIIAIGAGGIVRSAHLPTYRALGFPVAGVYDLNGDAATTIATEFSIPTVFPTLAAAVVEDAV